MKKALFIFIPLLYFIGEYCLPWNRWSGDSTISFSYFWDIIFIALCVYIFKLGVQFKIERVRNFLNRILFVFFFAVLCVAMINIIGLKTPFPYIEHSVLQLIILAPIIEELVFRYAFIGAQYNLGYSFKKTAITNAFLFSFSHGLVLPMIPQEFHPFIYFQMMYTFVLALVCAKSIWVQKSLLAPIILHFVFNYIFLFSLQKGWL